MIGEFDNEANKQLQAYPTPSIWVSRGQGPVTDAAVTSFSLESFNAVVGITASANDDATSGFALQSMLVNGPQPTGNIPDDGTSSFNLDSFIYVAPFAAPSQTDDAISGYALQSFINVAAQQSTSTDDATSGFALQSMIV